MQTLIIYESMYGNTHKIADAIAEGLAPSGNVTVVPVAAANEDLLREIDLVIVGGPTHGHGMSRTVTRQGAVDATRKPGSQLALEPGAHGPGVRDWLARDGELSTPAAAFDTRMTGPAVFTGRASRGIASHLRSRGCTMVAEPASFLVSKANELCPGEVARAREWGASLAAAAATVLAASR
jgi:hypothetical protein